MIGLRVRFRLVNLLDGISAGNRQNGCTRRIGFRNDGVNGLQFNERPHGIVHNDNVRLWVHFLQPTVNRILPVNPSQHQSRKPQQTLVLEH